MLRACLLLLLAPGCFAQTAAVKLHPSVAAARQWRQAHEGAILDELFSLLRIPNIAADKPNIRRNAEWILRLLEKRGLSGRLLEVPGANPAVFAERSAPGATRTVTFYGHYDGQPLDPRQWTTPPFEPVLRSGSLSEKAPIIPLPGPGERANPEARVFARSASDDKAPIIAILTALDALRAAGVEPSIHVKLIFEGEEENSSPNLERLLRAHKSLLDSSLWLICDGPVHQSRRQQLVFGNRGVVTTNLTVYGPKRELHSGHYGNWAPNPAFGIARLLASMKDDDGRILVDGFYSDLAPLTPLEKKAIAELPSSDEAVRRELEFGQAEGGGKPLAELIMLPSLNIRGMASARTGEGASNVIPASATATIDMRLVKGINPQQAVDRLAAHIRKQGFYLTDREPTPEERLSHPKVASLIPSKGGYPATRTPLDDPMAQLVVRTVESAMGPVIKLPTSGGSVPIQMIQEVLNVPSVSTPIVNHDNSQHSFDENLRLQNLWDGIELMAVLLTMER